MLRNLNFKIHSFYLII